MYTLNNKLSNSSSKSSTLSLRLSSSFDGVPSGFGSTLGFVSKLESLASVRSYFSASAVALVLAVTAASYALSSDPADSLSTGFPISVGVLFPASVFVSSFLSISF